MKAMQLPETAFTFVLDVHMHFAKVSVCLSVGPSIHLLVGRLVGRSVGRSVGWLVGHILLFFMIFIL